MHILGGDGRETLCTCPASDQGFNSSLTSSPFTTKKLRVGEKYTLFLSAACQHVSSSYFNLMAVKCATCSSVSVKKQQHKKPNNDQKKQSLPSPGVCTLLLTVKLTCPFRAAACIKSMTYWCGFPATTFLSTEMSSSPGRRRPSRSAGVFSMIAPITICSKTTMLAVETKVKRMRITQSPICLGGKLVLR